MIYVRLRNKLGEVVLKVNDERLQEVLNAGWRRFGDPNGSPFPTALQVAESATRLQKRKRGKR